MLVAPDKKIRAAAVSCRWTKSKRSVTKGGRSGEEIVEQEKTVKIKTREQQTGQLGNSDKDLNKEKGGNRSGAAITRRTGNQRSTGNQRCTRNQRVKTNKRQPA